MNLQLQVPTSLSIMSLTNASCTSVNTLPGDQQEITRRPRPTENYEVCINFLALNFQQTTCISLAAKQLPNYNWFLTFEIHYNSFYSLY